MPICYPDDLPLSLRITRERGALAHDDRLDAVEGAVKHWTKTMARDTDKAVAQHNAKLLDKELKKFRKSVFSVTARAHKKGRGASRRAGVGHIH